MSYTGQPLKRSEDPEFITGAGSFIDDINPSSTLHATVIRSTYAHARIKSIDLSSVRNQPGVVVALAREDFAGGIKDIAPQPSGAGSDQDDLKTPEHPFLAKDVVCYVGQPIAIVVAQDPSLAQDAVRHAEIDYEPLPLVLDPQQGLEPNSPLVHPDLGTNLALREVREGGDLEGAFSMADHVVSQSYHIPRIAPLSLETRGVVAEYLPQDDSLTVWNSTQAPHRVKSHLVDLLGLEGNKVRVIAPKVGGSFGVKDCVFPEDLLVPYLARRLEKPVKWVEDRQEGMLSYHGRGQTLDIEAAVRRDGTVLGIRVRIVSDLGAFFLTTTSSAPLNAGRRIMGPYKIPAARVEVLGVITNKTPTGAFRGTGGPESAYCMERTLDLIARDLKLDPIEVRKRNFIPADAFPYDTPIGVTYDTGDYERGLDRAMELIDYNTWRQRAQDVQKEEPLIGIGIATALKSSGSVGEHRVEGARIKIEESGRISAYTGISPHGQGTETSFAQIVADELGTSPSQVDVFHSDTETVPFGVGTSASRGIIVGGSAIYLVLQGAKTKLADLASALINCSAEDIVFRDVSVLNQKDPSQGMTLAQLAAVAHNEELLPSGIEYGLDFIGSYTMPSSPYSYTAHIAVVEVVPETGEVKILRYGGVNDCGHLINPKLVEGQFHGGIAQGVGQALFEAMVYTTDGQPLTGSLLDYAIPTAEDLPEPLLENMDSSSPTNLLGAKGVGSVPNVPSPAAVANAVMDALASSGIRHIDSPLTPEKIWRALQEQQN